MTNRGADYKKPQPAVIKYGPLQFLITDRPTDFNIEEYIEVSLWQGRGRTTYCVAYPWFLAVRLLFSYQPLFSSGVQYVHMYSIYPEFYTLHSSVLLQNLQSHQVVAVVRVCEPTYVKEPLESADITVYVRIVIYHSLC